MRSWYATAFWLLLFLNILVGLPFTYVFVKKGGLNYLAGSLGIQTDGREAKKYGNYYLNRVDLFERLEDSQSDIYFVGDSITDIAEWQELFLNPDIKNRGISGDTTEGVLNRLSEVVTGKPRKIFFMVGINNIQKQISHEETINDYKKIVSGVLEATPTTKVYIQSILPVNEKMYNREIIPRFASIHRPTEKEVIKINEALKSLSSQYAQVKFIDLSELNNTSGNLAAEYTFDGLHLNGKGLIAWSKIIQAFLQEE